MTTLVTGASGFIGSAVIRQLLARGERVRAMVRPHSDRRNLQGLDVEYAEGDLADPRSLQAVVEGCESLFHVAADYRLWARNPAHLYKVNVDGTKAIMSVANAAGIKRIVYTSSVATLGLHADGTPADEQTPAEPEDMIGHYKRSKYFAEQAVHNMVADEGLQAVIVNPSTPIGPRDIRPTPTGRMVLDAACGRMPAFVDTGLNIVHVDDVAKGHLLALENGRIGERYILGGENMTLQQILKTVAGLVNRPAPTIRLPHNLVLPIAYLSEVWARITRGREPRVTVDGVRMSKKHMYFSCDKAKRELHYQPRPAEEALRDAVEWFMQNDYCRR
jgi:dihydroflavonol-4-reductase